METGDKGVINRREREGGRGREREIEGACKARRMSCCGEGSE